MTMSDNHGFPDSKVHGANMGPTWVLSAPDEPHVGPINLAIRVASKILDEQNLTYKIWRRYDMETITTLLDLSDGNPSVTKHQLWFSFAVRLNKSGCRWFVTLVWHHCDGLHRQFTLCCVLLSFHYNDVIMGAIASQINSLTIVFSTVYLDTDQRKYQSSASLAFVRGIHRKPVNSPHKWPVTRRMFPFDDVIMWYQLFYPYPSACIRFQWLHHSQ